MKTKFIILLILLLTACYNSRQDTQEYISKLKAGDIVKYDIVITKTTTINLNGKIIEVLKERIVNREGDLLNENQYNLILELNKQKALTINK